MKQLRKIVERCVDQCTDPETGELHIGKYDHQFLENVIQVAITQRDQEWQEDLDLLTEEIARLREDLETQRKELVGEVLEKYIELFDPFEDDLAKFSSAIRALL